MKRLRLITVSIVLLSAAVWNLSAQEAAKPADKAEPPAATLDPKAVDVIKTMTESIKALKSFTLDVRMDLRMEAQGMKQQMTSLFTVALERPNKYASVLKDGMMGTTVVSDGKTLWVYLPMAKAYTEKEAPPTTGAIFAPGTDARLLAEGPEGMVISALARDDAYEFIMAGVKSGSYAGTEELDGKKVHHVKFQQEELDWEAWVDTGTPALPRKLTLDMSRSMRADASHGKITMIVEVANTNWMTNGPVAAERFQFTPPEGVRKVNSLREAMMNRADEEKEPETNALVGKPAPDFTLDLLAGEKVTLSQHKGKDIVILDFWATWCGPCRRAMPILVEVANAYKDKGVVLYGVNLRETPEVIKPFLEKNSLSLAVALDKDGKVGMAYQAKAIPQTVIVGKDGTVQVVHVGMAPNLKEVLTADLDALAAGKNLAGEAPKEEAKEEAPASAPAPEPAKDQKKQD